jgi:hypothetical protein
MLSSTKAQRMQDSLASFFSFMHRRGQKKKKKKKKDWKQKYKLRGWEAELPP